MEERILLPELFRKEYQKIVSVLCYRFGIHHIEVAQDIVSDTFLSATEIWRQKGLPDNPSAWLYTVASNKTKNYLKRESLFEQKLTPQIRYLESAQAAEREIDLSEKNITDSQLAMIFTVCNPCNPRASQVALALHLLCGFSIAEIAEAYLTNKDVIYKRVSRAKQKLREENIKIEQPAPGDITPRLENVLTTIYLLFSEGYYSTLENANLRKDLCTEAMRLCHLLTEQELTNQPAVNALMSLMCFHASRFDARQNNEGEVVLYGDQDETLWNQELIIKGTYFLAHSAEGTVMSKYHLEAGIAYWHTQKEDTIEKWNNILNYYNDLFMLENSPIVALNRTYALSKVKGKKVAIIEAEKLKLLDNHFYYSLLGELYTGLDDHQALRHFERALHLSRSDADQLQIKKHIEKLLLS
ncbi:RNA polymerase sigma-70 factor (ECF subfamily) [Pedobacter sp. CAN_A7]|uniref:RNA polymerase sigma factor n=1 Tax=Pedobacter sp. CAN_A7 TaxID=2787722 RepID=UPI0018CA356F